MIDQHDFQVEHGDEPMSNFSDNREFTDVLTARLARREVQFLQPELVSRQPCRLGRASLAAVGDSFVTNATKFISSPDGTCEVNAIYCTCMSTSGNSLLA
jgi:hypothetical protein